MENVILIACGKEKLERSAPAASLYISPLFQYSLAYARLQAPDERIYILSALYCLVPLNEKIAPYDITLASFSPRERLLWSYAAKVLLERRHDLDRTRFVMLAGQLYREHLVELLPHVHVPLEGKGIGRQLAWLKRTQCRLPDQPAT